jgi:hypothetical protein
VLSSVGIWFTAVERVEVMPVLEDVDAEFFGFRRCSANVCIVRMLGVDLDCDAYV